MAPAYDYQSLLIERDERLLKLTLNRPDSMNAVGGGMHEELEDFWYRVRDDASVGAILLTGAGRAFCVGGDVKRMAATAGGSDGQEPPRPAERVDSLLHGAKRLIMNMLDVEVPIVSAIHGYAMGLGASIGLCADIVVAADDAVIADTHVAVGLVAGDGGTVIWPALLPVNTAKYYLMTGERISGKMAAELGLVVKSVPAGDLHETALGIATKLAAGPTLAIKWTKAAINKGLRERANLLFDTSLVLEGATMLSDDHREATAAFVEKRPPRFTGR